MGNLFAAYQSPIEGSDKVNSYDKIMAYEEHYMKLLKHYLSEIQSIEKMLEDIRRERESFFQKMLPEIRTEMNRDEVSAEQQQEWLTTLHDNMERSFQISESLIQHYITKNLEEFKLALEKERDKL